MPNPQGPVSYTHLEQIELWNEKVVKSGLITSEERSLVTFEDYKYYCESQGRDPFDEILKLDRTHYLQMQVADYILNNMDRHTGNWGLFMDNRTGALMRLHPLMDHDHEMCIRDRFITHNYMGFANKVDYYDLSVPLDFVSHDQYPCLLYTSRCV